MNAKFILKWAQTAKAGISGNAAVKSARCSTGPAVAQQSKFVESAAIELGHA
jgi:hypothetical protein